MKKIMGLLVITLLMSGCSKIREQTFNNNICRATSEADISICKCMFDVMDDQLVESIGQTWIYRPTLLGNPAFGKALDESAKCSGYYGGR